LRKKAFPASDGRILLIANPASGRGSVSCHIEEVVQHLKGFAHDLTVVQTKAAGDAKRAAGRFSGGLIISYGGDGTFNEILNGADLDRCTLGVIPAGTGNVLAKELGIPKDHLAALRALAGGTPREMDTGLCNGRRFACVFGAGIDAHIVRLVHKNRAFRLTQLHYVPYLVHSTLCPEQWNITARMDGKVFAEGMNILCIGNTRSYGGPISVTSGACPVDGELDILASRVGNPLDMLNPGTAALLRSLHLSGGAKYGRGVEFEITSPRPDVPWEIDGEFGGYLPARIRCQPRTMQILAPKSF
jgi:diacylglycerol kinase (ATP)